MNKISLIKLFLIFAKVGAILLGGGYVILPILLSEIVEKRELIKQEDLINYFALSQSLPGIIAANISMFVGYKLRGKTGAVIAMLGIISVPFFSIILLASLIENFATNQLLQGALWGIGIAVIALIMLTVREMWRNVALDGFFYIIFFLSLISLVFFSFSPIKTIFVFSILGIVYKIITTPKEAR